MRTKKHRTSPELRYTFTLNSNVLYVLRIFGWFNRWNNLIERDVNTRPRINSYFDGFAVEVSGSAVPLLSFTPVHRQLDRMAIRAVKGFITMQHSLDPILASRNLRQSSSRITKRVSIHNFGLFSLPTINIDSKDLLCIQVYTDLKSRLFFVVG